jgi:MarR family transcriptional regulator, organic hydroperoxide resistance regulator
MRRMTFSFLSPIHKATRQVAVHLAGPCAEEGVSTAEGHLLSYLRSYGPCAISTILSVFGLKASTATSMLQRLVDRGLVARGPAPGDRRSVLVRLTRRGIAAADRLRRRLVQLETSIHSRLSEREIEGFRAVMRAIEEATLPHAGKESKP